MQSLLDCFQFGGCRRQYRRDGPAKTPTRHRAHLERIELFDRQMQANSLFLEGSCFLGGNDAIGERVLDLLDHVLALAMQLIRKCRAQNARGQRNDTDAQ